MRNFLFSTFYSFEKLRTKVLSGIHYIPDLSGFIRYTFYQLYIGYIRFALNRVCASKMGTLLASNNFVSSLNILKIEKRTTLYSVCVESGISYIRCELNLVWVEFLQNGLLSTFYSFGKLSKKRFIRFTLYPEIITSDLRSNRYGICYCCRGLLSSHYSSNAVCRLSKGTLTTSTI